VLRSLADAVMVGRNELVKGWVACGL